jgi:DNA-binding NtrC family response regulator
METERAGVQLLQDVKGKSPGIGRILVSGHVDEIEAKNLLEIGVAHAVLQKPWDIADLLRAVTRYSSSPPPPPDGEDPES